FLGQLRQGGDLLALSGQVLVRFQQSVEWFDLGDDLLGPVRVVPEIGGAHLRFELIALLSFAGDVKESPAAGSAGSSPHRCDGADRYSSRSILVLKGITLTDSRDKYSNRPVHRTIEDQCSVFSVQCSVFSVQCSVFSVQCSVQRSSSSSLNTEH